jgi:hypothetical protein
MRHWRSPTNSLKGTDKGGTQTMLRFVVALNSDFTQNPDPKLHYFDTFGMAEIFAKKNRHFLIECYSEEKIEISKLEYWQRRATYNIYVDPNQ